MFRKNAKTTQPEFPDVEGKVSDQLEQLYEWHQNMVHYLNSGHQVEANDLLVDLFNAVGYLLNGTRELASAMEQGD